MNDKIVAFAGHRYDWQNIGIDKKLKEIIICLIEKGYKVFFDGGKGFFDKLTSSIILELKKQYKDIKLYRVLANYQSDSKKLNLPIGYDGIYMPEVEQFHPKARIKKRNEWIVDQCDILVCHIFETYKSGAYTMLKYAQKKNKHIINI